MSKLFIDSNCELWFDKAEEIGAGIISMPYTIDGQQYYYDLGRNTDFVKFFETVKSGKVPITSALNEFDYTEIFEPVLASGEDILYLSFSHQMSATFNQLDLAKAELLKKYPDRKITVYDTKKISLGSGLPIYYAGKMHKEGKSDEEIIAYLDNLLSFTGVLFTVDDLNHLKRGGRLTAVQAFLGTILKLKPLLNISNEGKLANFHKVKGRMAAMHTFISIMKEQGLNKAFPVCVIDANVREEGDALANLIKEEFGEDVVFWRHSIGPVIGAHCGPGTIGLIYIAQSKVSEYHFKA